MMPTDVAIGGAVILLAAVVAGVAQRRRVQASEPFRAWDPTVYELAAMVGGERRVAEVAAAFLVWNGLFEVRENTRRIVLTAPPSRGNEFHPVEVAMINAAGLEGAPASAVVAAGMQSAEAVAASIPGLAVDRATRSRIAAIPAVAGLSTALVLGWWMWWRLSDDLAVGWVPVVCAVALVVAALALIDPPYATTFGMGLVEERRRELGDQVAAAAGGVTALPLVEGMTVVALLGSRAMSGRLIGLKNVLRT